MEFVRVYHPDLDAHSTVAVSAVPHMEDKGWQLVDGEDSNASALYAPSEPAPAPAVQEQEPAKPADSDRRKTRRKE